MTHQLKSDAIDKIIDQIVSEPDKAEELKNKLHGLATPVKPSRVKPTKSQWNDDFEDMFDNMPV